MPAAETADTRKAKAETARFVSDEQGRLLFYPSGLSRTGYVVDNSACERVLREAAARYNARARWFALLFGLPVLAVFYRRASFHPLLALGLIGALAPPVQFAEELVSGMVFRRQVGDLERVAARRPGWLIPTLLLGPVAAGWIIVELYNWRVAALPEGDAINVFYADISWGVISALGGGLILFGFSRLPSSHFGGLRSRLAVAFSAAMTFGGFVLVFIAFIDSKPVVTVTRGILFCGWDVAWLEVSDIGLKTDIGTRFVPGGAWAEVAIEPGSSTELRDRRAGLREPLSCRIDRLNVDYEKVYEAIRAAWTAAQSGRAQNAASH